MSLIFFKELKNGIEIIGGHAFFKVMDQNCHIFGSVTHETLNLNFDVYF